MTEIMPNPQTESDGVARTRFNAVRHGILSRYTVLPWEDAEEYDPLLLDTNDLLEAENSPPDAERSKMKQKIPLHQNQK
jgi:hypothetical protein